MDFETTMIEAVTLVAMEGNLDTNTSVDAQSHINALIDEGATKLLTDFTKVDFVSSAGLRVLLATAKNSEGSGAVYGSVGSTRRSTRSSRYPVSAPSSRYFRPVTTPCRDFN